MAYEALEDLEIFQVAERICDRLYELVHPWPALDKETVGVQMLRAADSIGANVAESYGRYHYGEKLNFLYYARGSLYETKYWVRRCQQRRLLPADVCGNAQKVLNELAVKLNALINNRRNSRNSAKESERKLTETLMDYDVPIIDNSDEFMQYCETDFTDTQSSNYQSPNRLF